MSKRTIEAFEEVVKKQAAEDRPTSFLGCHCTGCNTTWIVCEFPQPIGKLPAMTGKHRFCPCCKSENPHIATTAQVRLLLAVKS